METVTSASSLYTPLKRWQTRILRLSAGQGDDTLSGDVLVADVVHMEGLALHDEGVLVAYEAISYTWGRPTLTGDITINGHHHSITPTLESALKHFRYHDKVRYLWGMYSQLEFPDALCIDQANDDEKSEQVQEMFNIYRKAQGVLVWLGESSLAADWLLNNLRNVFSTLGDEPSPTQLVPISTSGVRVGNLVELGFIRDGDPILWAQGLRDLVDRPWTRRVWVQQEIFAARTASIHCGESIFTLEAYHDAAEMLYDLKSEASRTWWTSSLDTACSNVRNLTQASVERTVQLELIRSLGETGAGHLMPYPNPAPSMRLDSVLLRTKDLMATDLRDKIYALLPLSGCRVSTMHDIKRPDVPTFLVDYKRSLAVVYQDLTKYIINRDRSLDVLQALRFQSERLQTLGALQLPSWTPDWSDLTAYEKHCAVSASLSSDQAQRSFPVPWQHTAEVGVLHVNGVIMGAIRERAVMTKEQISTLTEHARAGSDPSTWDSMMYTIRPSPAHYRLDHFVKPGDFVHKPEAWTISESTLLLGDDEVLGELVLNHRAEIGDHLVVLDDIRRPVVLRRTGNNYSLISTVVQVMLFGNNVDIGWQYMHALYDCVLGQRLAVRESISLR
ncbi:hypothetical protein LTR49_015948 [Elasticomyces elasticus]|nr:hypothetical protein LTR49_015948 [Elasticomyces elasticus]KAK5755419.1 hypothetical protein LTS12_014526 [Elasticomyces elasticus]